MLGGFGVGLLSCGFLVSIDGIIVCDFGLVQRRNGLVDDSAIRTYGIHFHRNQIHGIQFDMSLLIM